VLKDQLITNELNLFSPAAIKKILIATYERKQMSTKTLRKRIAFVAVAALGFGVVTGVQAKATVTGTFSATYDATNGVGIVGGTAKLRVTSDAAATLSIVVSGVGSVITSTVDGTDFTHNTVDSGATGTPAYTLNGPTSWTDAAGGGAGYDDITLTSTVVGATTVTITPVVSGIPGTAVVKTLTWSSADGTAINAGNTIISVVDTRAHCASSTSLSDDINNLTNLNAVSSGSYRNTSPAADTFGYLCVIIRDGNGNRVASTDKQIWNISAGSLDNTGTLTRAATANGTAGTGTGAFYYPLAGDNIAPVKGASLSVTLIKGSTSITKSITFDFYGKIASVGLSSVTSSVAPGDFGPDYQTATSATTKAQTTILAYVTCKDKNDVKVVHCDYNGTGTSLVLGTNAYIVGDSDKVSGTPSFSATSPATNVEAGALTPSVVWNTASSVNAVKDWLKLDVSSTTTDLQKTSYTLYAKDASETTPSARIKSNSVDFFLSGAVAKVAVTPSATSGNPGGAITVNVSATDANGYPIEDGSTISLLASNGGTVAPNSKSTFAGGFATPATAVLGNGDTVITAVSGSKSGNATVKVSGGVSSTDAQIASLIAKINALTKLIAKIQKKLGVK